MSFFSKYKEIIIIALCLVLLIVIIQTSITRGSRVDRETKTVKVKLME